MPDALQNRAPRAPGGLLHILVSHPHVAAVSAWVARSLERAGALARFDTGVAATPGSRRGRLLAAAAGRRPALGNRMVQGVLPEHLRSHASVELTARALGRAQQRLSPYDALFLAHDAAVVASRWPAGVSAVYAYEDGARWTFERAQRAGLQRVWDLPSPEWRLVERLNRDEAARWPGAMAVPPGEPDWKKQRKDRERALADVAVVASAFTRQSLLDVGFDKPVVVTPYGFPAQQFTPRTARPDGPFTVIAVGNHSLRKGTPWLLEAWKQAALPDARLVLIGSLQLSEAFLRPYRGLFEHIRHVPRSQLAAHYQAADLLAFPTLGDGFGLVIVEAMCAATPVLTTRCGGGPECITDGVDGLLVPERNLEALVAALRGAHADRERLFQLGLAARRRAESYDDARAGDALVQNLSALLK